MDEDVLGPLRLQVVDVETAAESGLLGSSDEEQLAYAAAQGRVLVTSNVSDFARLHRRLTESEQAHAGIVVIHQQRFSVGEVIRRLRALVSAKLPDEMKNQLIYLSSMGLSED